MGIAVCSAAALAPSRADAEDTTNDTQALVERYAPVFMVKQQDGPCDTDGEPFEPAPVDIVLDNPEVFLRQVGNDDPVAMRAPGSADLFDLREGWYLDFPGDALAPGCIFEQDFDRWFDGQSTVYAHVATQTDRPGLLALQYWSFWYHNPAKNNHEGDWEFVQLLFEADTVSEALDGSPIAVGYAQHTGGERASTGDPKLEFEGSRPVVYAARGSHASYFGSALFLGRSGREGFGCDNTDGPSRRIDPAVVVLPDTVTNPDDPLAWLTFQGRWGQREPGFFNGPTGPYAKDRWTEPVTWQEGLRSSSVVIPGGDRYGDTVITAFCGSVEFGSTVLTATVRSPSTLLAVVAMLVAIVVLAVRRTTWHPVVTEPVVADRAFGQIIRAAGRLFARHPIAMLGIGFVYVPVGLVTSVIEAGVLALPFVDDLLGVAGKHSSISFLLTMLVGGIAEVLALVYVTAVVAKCMARPELLQRRPWAILHRDELVRLMRSTARAAIVVVALILSIVGVPWGLRQLVRYQVAPHAVVIEGETALGALQRSSALVRTRWWWTAGAVLAIDATVLIAGFAAAIGVLLIVTSLPLWAFHLVSSLIFVVLVPIGAAATTYLYGTLRARSGDDDKVTTEHATAEPSRR